MHVDVFGDNIERLPLGNDLPKLICCRLLAVDGIFPVLIGQAIESISMGAGGRLHSQLPLPLQHGQYSLQIGLHILVAIPHSADMGCAAPLGDSEIVFRNIVRKGIQDQAEGCLVIHPKLIDVVDPVKPVVVIIREEVLVILLREAVLLDTEGQEAPLPDSTTVTDFTMHHRSSRRERFL